MSKQQGSTDLEKTQRQSQGPEGVAGGGAGGEEGQEELVEETKWTSLMLL